MPEKIIVERNKKIAELQKNRNNLLRIKDELKPHLCWSCQNGYPSKCLKVAMQEKAKIGAYPFIKSGYQVFSKNALTKEIEISTFVVTECSDYVTTNEKYVVNNSVKENRDAAKLTRKK